MQLAANTMASTSQYVGAIRAAVHSDEPMSAECLPRDLQAAVVGHVGDMFPNASEQHMARIVTAMGLHSGPAGATT